MSAAEEMASIINNRISEMIHYSNRPAVELGTFQDNGSLKLDNFPGEITGFLISRSLKRGATGEVLTKTKDGQGTHDHSCPVSSLAGQGDHVHDVLIPETMRTVKGGDRVLVVWAANVPVIVDILEDWG